MEAPLLNGVNVVVSGSNPPQIRFSRARVKAIFCRVSAKVRQANIGTRGIYFNNCRSGGSWFVVSIANQSANRSLSIENTGVRIQACVIRAPSAMRMVMAEIH